MNKPTNPYITIKLNNDMTRVIEQLPNGDFQTYTCMGTDKDINFDEIITSEELGGVLTIPAQEMFNFSFNPSVEEMYRLRELEYRADDVLRHADELDIDLSTEEAMMLAERFINKYEDCNLPENTVFEQMLNDYIKDRDMELE